MIITIPVAILFHWLGYSSNARSFMAGSIFMLYLTNTWNHRFIKQTQDSKSYDHDMHNYKTSDYRWTCGGCGNDMEKRDGVNICPKCE